LGLSYSYQYKVWAELGALKQNRKKPEGRTSKDLELAKESSDEREVSTNTIKTALVH